MTEIRFWKAVAYLLIVGAAILFLAKVWSVLLPFVFGLLIAYLLHPLVEYFVAIGFRRDRTVIVLYVLFLGVASVLAALLLPDLFRETDAAVKALRSYADTFNALVHDVTVGVQSMLRHLIGRHADAISIPFRADRVVESIVRHLPENILNVVHAGLWIFIIPFVSFFALAQGRSWIELLFDWTPSENVEGLLGILAEVNATLGGYLRGQMLDALCVGLATITGLLALGVEGAVLLGVVTGLLNVIPYMAPLVGGGLALFSAYVQGAGPSVYYGIVILYLLVRVLDDFVLLPFIVGSTVSLHPVVMLFAILAGVQVGGFIGLVFAIPAAAIVKVILSISLRNRRERLLFNHNVVS